MSCHFSEQHSLGQARACSAGGGDTDPNGTDGTDHWKTGGGTTR